MFVHSLFPVCIFYLNSLKMEIEKLSDFLQNCCRVCLAIENETVDSTNIVESFNKTIDQLLFECADMKVRFRNCVN